MISINGLFKKTGIYFIGNITSKILIALEVPLYAFFVSSEALGLYDYCLSIAQICSPLIFAAIWEAILKNLLKIDSFDERKTSVSSVLLFAGIQTLVIFGFTWFLLILFNIDRLIVISVSLFSTFLSLAQIWQYFARSFGRTKLYAISGICSALLSFACFVILVCVLNLQILGLSITFIVSQLIIILIIEFKLHLFSYFNIGNISKKLICSYLKYSLPCVLNLISSSLIATIGRLVIVNVLGDDANGQYVFAMKFGGIISAVGAVFSMAVIEEGIIREGGESFSTFYSSLISSMLCVVIALVCVALPACAIFYDFLQNTNYFNTFYLVPIFLIYGATSTLCTLFGSIFMAVGATQHQASSTFISMVITTVFTLLSINYFGLLGASISLMIGTISMVLIRYKLSKKWIEYQRFPLEALFFIGLYIFIWVCLTLPIFNTLSVHVITFILVCVIVAPITIKNIKTVNNL